MQSLFPINPRPSRNHERGATLAGVSHRAFLLTYIHGTILGLKTPQDRWATEPMMVRATTANRLEPQAVVYAIAVIDCRQKHDKMMTELLHDAKWQTMVVSHQERKVCCALMKPAPSGAPPDRARVDAG